MENLLTNEEKKYLRMISNYLKSYGLTYGDIYIDLEGGYISDINWDWVTYFENKYGLDIPDGLKPILEKLSDKASELHEIPYVDDLNYDRLEIGIDTNRSEISFIHVYGYTSPGSEDNTEWDENDDDITSVLNSITEQVKGKYTELLLSYHGSGDEGYLEDRFSDGKQVPDLVSDWCYSQLSLNYGGWENNEGATGYFEFDFSNREIRLYHTWMEYTNEENTLLELSFSK
jgi:hypothetical protein